jgi:hypothetical protein
VAGAAGHRLVLLRRHFGHLLDESQDLADRLLAVRGREVLQALAFVELPPDALAVSFAFEIAKIMDGLGEATVLFCSALLTRVP